MYEENIAKINSELNPTLKTVYFRSNNEVISSSLVRELLKYNEDISIVVAQVAFIHKRKGYMTKLYEILCHMKKIYKLNYIFFLCFMI